MTARLAERIAEQLRNQLPRARELPLDVEGLAVDLGVDEIIRMDGLVEDGRLEQCGGHIRVLVASRASLKRQRYTIAHEIGHLVLHRDIYAGLQHAKAKEQSGKDLRTLTAIV